MKLRLISGLAAAAAILLSFSSCQKNALPVLAPGQRADHELVVADFESLREIRNMNYINEFGRAAVNTDKQYITSGGGSLELEVLGNPSQGQTYYPTFLIYTNKKYNALDKQDFSDVTLFKFDMYNAGEQDMEVSFGLNSASTVNGGALPRTPFTLKKGEWTNVAIPFESAAVALTYDIKNIDYFMFVFENRKQGETPAKVYIDNFVAVTGEPEAVSKEREPDELIGFESAADVQMMFSGGIYYQVWGNPMFTWNKDLEYVTQGRRSLKITSKAFGPNPYSGVNDSPVISLNEEALKDNADFSQYAAVSFDMFNASGQNVVIAFYLTDGKTTYAKYNLNVKKDRWNTFTIPVEEIKKAVNNTESIDITKITRMSWAWNGFQEGENYVLYLDNVRFVR